MTSVQGRRTLWPRQASGSMAGARAWQIVPWNRSLRGHCNLFPTFHAAIMVMERVMLAEITAAKNLRKLKEPSEVLNGDKLLIAADFRDSRGRSSHSHHHRNIRRSIMPGFAYHFSEYRCALPQTPVQRKRSSQPSGFQTTSFSFQIPPK